MDALEEIQRGAEDDPFDTVLVAFAKHAAHTRPLLLHDSTLL